MTSICQVPWSPCNASVRQYFEMVRRQFWDPSVRLPAIIAHKFADIHVHELLVLTVITILTSMNMGFSTVIQSISM